MYTRDTPHTGVKAFWGANLVAERWQAVLDHAAPHDRILDLGAGRGAYTRALAERGYRPVGLDLHLYPEWRTPPRQAFVAGAAGNLPFRDGAFDMTIAFEVLEHCPQPDRVLAEIVRCTTRHVILSVPNCDIGNSLRQYDLAPAHWTDTTHCNFFTKATIADLVRAAGLNIVRIADCYRISPNNYYWDTLKIPRPLATACKRLVARLHLAEEYWSSILVVAALPGRAR